MSLTHLDANRSMPLVTLPLRTSVAELKGARVLFAPASTLSPARYSEAGEITDIVVPNLYHLEGAGPAMAAHPKARLWLPAGAEAKDKRALPHSVLGKDSWPYEEELPLFPLGGMPAVAESVLLHRASGSLLVGDLAFNLIDASGLGARLIFGLFGTYQRFAVSRLFLRGVSDRAAFLRSLEELLAQDFSALVPTHGNIVATEARERLRSALGERGVHIGGRSAPPTDS